MDATQSASPRPFIPIAARLYAPFSSWGWALIRFATGAILIPHGWQKLFAGGADVLAGKTLTAWGLPAPALWAYGVGTLELAGGALLALGLLTRPVALLFVIELLVINIGVHWGNGWAWGRGGMQYTVFLLAVCLAACVRGGGEHSLDRRIGKEF